MGNRAGIGAQMGAVVVTVAVVLAACGGGGGEDVDAADRAERSAATDTSVIPGDEATDAEDAADVTAPEASGGDAAPAEGTSGGDAPAPGGTAGATTTAPAGASQGGGGGAAIDDAGALARTLRVADLPSGYQKNQESTGANEEQERFADAFAKCMGAAGVDASTLPAPTGQAARSFSDGPKTSPQEPDEVGASVLGFADAGAAQRVIQALDTLFSSKPGRDCVADEVEKALAAQIQQVAPGAQVDVRAEASTTYAPAGAHAQLRLVSTVTIGVQEFVFVTDVVSVQAGAALANVALTNEDKPFDAAVGRPIVDKALVRLGG